MPDPITNVYGEEVPEIHGDIWEVPPEERQDDDSGEGSNAMQGGDDLGDWTPKDYFDKQKGSKR